MSEKIENISILKELFNLKGIANGSSGSYKVIDDDLYKYWSCGANEWGWLKSNDAIWALLNDNSLEFDNYEKVYTNGDYHSLFNVGDIDKEYLEIYFAGNIQRYPHDIISEILKDKGTFYTGYEDNCYHTIIKKKCITPDFFQNLKSMVEKEYYKSTYNQKDTIEQIEELLKKLK